MSAEYTAVYDEMHEKYQEMLEKTLARQAGDIPNSPPQLTRQNADWVITPPPSPASTTDPGDVSDESDIYVEPVDISKSTWHTEADTAARHTLQPLYEYLLSDYTDRKKREQIMNRPTTLQALLAMPSIQASKSAPVSMTSSQNSGACPSHKSDEPPVCTHACIHCVKRVRGKPTDLKYEPCDVSVCDDCIQRPAKKIKTGPKPMDRSFILFKGMVVKDLEL